VQHLYTPAAIATLTPCTFHPSFLPRDLADALLDELLADAPSWRPNSFRLFDRAVVSPHTSCFYASPSARSVFADTFYDSGSAIADVRTFGPALVRAQGIIEKIVNGELAARERMQWQYPGRWTADVALCNRYAGPRESVGMHSDRLTHLGPMPVIASISLGATREFRLRELVGTDKKTYSVHLPHNSLLIMHAPCQERFKHAVIPVHAVDLHPVAGAARINITYRMYRDCFAPRNIPQCKCAVPMILRCVSSPGPSEGRYFWACAAAYVREHGCDAFTWAQFTPDGDPIV
ncbi:uncharacterized protein V1518DRAFT_362035, partial [Limtongia smithiae]|uniref:uncharacterized protein n=1 Tax=Limtongia smithiae TaxID=1125753 RepID=UPI0034CD1233